MLFHDLTAVSILAIKIMSFIIKDCGILISLLTNSQPWHLCARALWHAKILWLHAAKKMPSRDSRLALSRLVHSLASNLQVPLWCQQGSVVEA